MQYHFLSRTLLPLLPCSLPPFPPLSPCLQVFILPTIRINGVQYRGKMATAEVLRAICAGFVAGNTPQACSKVGGWAGGWLALDWASRAANDQPLHVLHPPPPHSHVPPTWLKPACPPACLPVCLCRLQTMRACRGARATKNALPALTARRRQVNRGGGVAARGLLHAAAAVPQHAWRPGAPMLSK